MKNESPDSERPDYDPRLAELIELVVDGAATNESIQQLETLLHDDPDARRYYRRVMELHAGLRWMHRVPRPAADLPTQPPTVGISATVVSATELSEQGRVAGINGVLGSNPASIDGTPGAASSTAIQKDAAPVSGINFLGSPSTSSTFGNRLLGFGLFASAIAIALFFAYPRERKPNDADAPPAAMAAAQPVTVFRLDSGTAEVALANTSLGIGKK